MTIQYQIYDTQTLLEVLRYIPPRSDYWLGLCFPRELQFTTQFIDFEKLVKYKKLAPLVVPMSQGKPIYKEQASITRIRPAYLKPKDPVNAAEMIARRPGNLDPMNPAGAAPLANYETAVAQILLQHRDAIERRWELMAAKAAIDGKVLLESEDYPARLIDFGRDAEQTVVKGGGTRWGDAGIDIITDIEAWRAIMRNKPFAGPTNRLTMGSKAWQAFRNDANVFKTLNTLTRGTTSDVKVTDPLTGYIVEYVGRLGDLECYVYNDFYQEDDGTAVPIMAATDVVLTGPNVDGVRAFGAILDKKASFNALPMFPKLWDEDDPPATFIMTQSAPLMVPVNPNNTFKATVVAA